ncbi:HipA domain-containing protein [Salegentibacter salegens]|uniref:Serine/threonine-protein kinase HipA n=1 Tax=Salegentibacter salegens TaxID=143223 RepID=A0A1M7K9N2_9FLAO|nr:HipA domain-containing protein [Salegentibacter salegens]PRX44396.1 serine/threonine-protein kinase HipA [Salegentibacter salegens]SHM61891.1 serine/threonine-protein kinase HipA [Salegentibacter salegens]
MQNRCLYCYRELADTDLKDFHTNCSVNFFGTEIPPQLEYSLDQMVDLAKNVVERRIAVPGVQPKLSLSFIDNALASENNRLTVVGALGGNYILKPPSEAFAEMPQNEHFTMRMAEGFGIRTVPSSLIRLKSGELAYITKRIDRTLSNEKIHMLDMFQILEAFDKYKGSMEKVGKAIGNYSSNTLLDKLYFFEIAVFSFLTGNNDMHLKNFSLIKRSREWVLSPAYDLLNVAIVNPEDDEELALTLEGKRKKLAKEHFVSLGEKLELNKKQIDGVFKRFINNKKMALSLLESSFLSNEYKQKYSDLLEQRYLKLE